MKRLKEGVCKGRVVADHSDILSKDVNFLIQTVEEGVKISCLGMTVALLVKMAVGRMNKLPIKSEKWRGDVFIFETLATKEELAEILPFSLEKMRLAA